MLNTKLKKWKKTSTKQQKLHIEVTRGKLYMCVYTIPSDKSQNIYFYFLF